MFRLRYHCCRVAVLSLERKHADHRRTCVWRFRLKRRRVGAVDRVGRLFTATTPACGAADKIMYRGFHSWFHAARRYTMLGSPLRWRPRDARTGCFRRPSHRRLGRWLCQHCTRPYQDVSSSRHATTKTRMPCRMVGCRGGGGGTPCDDDSVLRRECRARSTGPWVMPADPART